METIYSKHYSNSNQQTMKPIAICYPKCGTCQKAEKWMKSNGIEYTYRPIKEENPTKEELKTWIAKSGLPLSKFFNTSGLLYKEQNMKDKVKILSESELIDILASNGLMVKRPILLAGNTVLVGFREEEWSQLLK
jgi:transcriptional regulator, Spx/MgsR family